MGQLSSSFVKLARIILSWFSSPESEKFYGKAVEHFNAYISSPNAEDLRNAYSNYKSARLARQKEKNPATPEGYEDLLLNLGTAYYTQSKASAGEDNSIDKALELYDEFGTLPVVQKAARAKGLLMRGKTLVVKYDQDKTPRRLDDAIISFQNALEISQDRQEISPDLASVRFLCLYSLATTYDMLYTSRKAIEYLDKAIDGNYEFRQEAPVDHPERPSCLYNLARQLFSRYQSAQGKEISAVESGKRKGVEDLKEAGTIAREAKGLLLTVKAVPGLEENVDKLLAVIKEHASEDDAPEGWETVGVREG